jgi:DNA polymerase III delta subunit
LPRLSKQTLIQIIDAVARLDLALKRTPQPWLLLSQTLVAMHEQ